MKSWLLATACVATAAGASAAQPRWAIAGADVDRGRALVESSGCAKCHTIPGIRAANGNVGPPLDKIADRQFIAGVLRNEPSNLMRWLRHPQQVVPGNAMPEMDITSEQARDIAAFLYTLR